MENSQDVAAIQAQIAALQAQLQELLAQPAPEPEVDAEAALQRGTEASMQEAIAEGAALQRGTEASMQEAIAEGNAMQEAVEQAVEQALAGGSDFDPLAFADISPQEQEAHLQRKQGDHPRRTRAGILKSREMAERSRELAERRETGHQGRGEESYDDPDPTGEEYDAAFDGSADREGRSTYAPSEFPLGDTGEAEPEPEADWQDQEPTGPDDPRYAEPEPAAAAPDQALLEQLFLDAHGGPFDPASDLDGGKMKSIQELLASGQDFGDLAADEKARTRFALQLYRQ